MRVGCEGKSGDDSGAKQSRGRSSPSRESWRQGSRFQTSASTLFFFLSLRSFPLASSRQREFTVIKSVINAPFVCCVFHLSLRVTTDCMYKEAHVLLRVQPCIVYAHMCVLACMQEPSAEARVTSRLSASSNRNLRTNWLKETRKHIGGTKFRNCTEEEKTKKCKRKRKKELKLALLPSLSFSV